MILKHRTRRDGKVLCGGVAYQLRDGQIECSSEVAAIFLQDATRCWEVVQPPPADPPAVRQPEPLPELPKVETKVETKVEPVRRRRRGEES
jgi:hypothetical protein